MSLSFTARKLINHLNLGIATLCLVCLSTTAISGDQKTLTGIDEKVVEYIELTKNTLEYVEKAGGQQDLSQELSTLISNIESTGGNAESLKQLKALRRKILFSHPKLQFKDLLFNLRKFDSKQGYKKAEPRHMVDSYLAGNHVGPWPGISILKNWKSTPEVIHLTQPQLEPGMTFHPDLSFDAKKVVFSYAKESKDITDKRYHLWEIGLDGTGLRQITGGQGDTKFRRHGRKTSFIEDFDPVYLPDGGFAFVSSRVMTTVRCVNNKRYNPAFVLYRCDNDGSNIRALSYGELNEYDPTVLPDGRLLYTRWEYVNRNLQLLHGLWSTNIDGTGTAHVYGNNTIDPNLINQGRPIPGSHKLMATANAHHNVQDGTIITVDPAIGEDGMKPITMLTPDVSIPEQRVPMYMKKGLEITQNENGVYTFGLPYSLNDKPQQATPSKAGTFHSYIMPYPITEELFFVSVRDKRHGGKHSLYLLDSFGGRELIYKDPTYDVGTIIPIQPRPVPPVRSSLVNTEQDSGTFIIQDVYRNRFDKTGKIKRGSVKKLRVLEVVDQAAQKYAPNSKYIFETPKRILGTVPVEKDGSVAFNAPAGKTLQFQLLDQDNMAVMSMRTVLYLQPGEVASCVGCHEEKQETPRTRGTGQVKIRKLEAPAWNNYEGGFSFMRTVQPVLDRYCIECHGLDDKKKAMSLLSKPLKRGYAVNGNDPRIVLTWPGRKDVQATESYHNLIGKDGLVSMVPYMAEPAVSQPYDFYAHAGKLAHMLIKGHKDVKLDEESLGRVISWLDTNAAFASDYSFNRVEDRELDQTKVGELRAKVKELLGVWGRWLGQTLTT